MEISFPIEQAHERAPALHHIIRDRDDGSCSDTTRLAEPQLTDAKKFSKSSAGEPWRVLVI
jgi:hypothetical protein